MIELSSYSLKSGGLGNGLKNAFFTAQKGEVWKVESDNINDSHLLINGLATLSYPSEGTYHFEGKKLNFSDYRRLLSTKKRIAYIASDATLISNRTVQENLSINRLYFENDLSPELNERECSICEMFNIGHILGVRPSELKPPDIRKAILVREFLKDPELILMENPDDFSGPVTMPAMIDILKLALDNDAVLIYTSRDSSFIRNFNHNTINIQKGQLSVTPATETT